MFKVITRAAAKALGERFYFTGRLCLRGGLALRQVSDGRCLCELCRKERNKDNSSPATLARAEKWRLRNPGYWKGTDRKLSEAGKARKRLYYQANRGKILARNKDLAAKLGSSPYYNPDKAKVYYLSNRERLMARAREWGVANPAKRAICRAKRRALELSRVPSWFGELDDFVIGECALVAQLRAAATGIAHHVDHMIPLCAKTASGLHCALNLQVIPAYLNLSKSNRIALSEPGEWVRFI